jgi:hypothetical protein
MPGFTRTDSQALVSCLGDPQRAVAAYHELLRCGKGAVGALSPAVRKKAGWFTPGGTIYQRTIPRVPR